MKKIAVIVVVIILIILGAQQALNQINQNGLSSDSIDLGSLVTSSPNSDQPNPLLNTTEKNTMKTLADFEPIAASQVTLKTTKGDITFKLFSQEAPLTATNFLNLAKNGFYDGVVFHRVIPDFMAQVGDPLSKDESQKSRWGTGGPGYSIADELNPKLKHDKAGIVSMANAGPNTGGSQFFITHVPTPWLDGKHAIFGEVIQGLEVLNQIEVGDKIISVSYQ